MTINELYKQCKEQIDKGLGDCEILVCDNDICSNGEPFSCFSLTEGFSPLVYNYPNVKSYAYADGLDNDTCLVLNSIGDYYE